MVGEVVLLEHVLFFKHHVGKLDIGELLPRFFDISDCRLPLYGLDEANFDRFKACPQLLLYLPLCIELSFELFVAARETIGNLC